MSEETIGSEVGDTIKEGLRSPTRRFEDRVTWAQEIESLHVHGMLIPNPSVESFVSVCVCRLSVRHKDARVCSVPAAAVDRWLRLSCSLLLLRCCVFGS